MAKHVIGRALVGAAALGLVLAACSTGGGTSGAATEATAAAAGSTDCPASPAPEAPTTELPETSQVPIASSVADADATNSTVISATGAQIQCGAVEVESHDDIVYSTTTTAGAERELKLDIIEPQTDGAKPLVVYIPGGGFVFAAKEGSLNRRTYVAEQDYVVASIEYRTTLDGATYADGLADVKSAIRYLRANAEAYNIDADNVAVWGDSAGGYLAAMAGTTGGVEEFDVGDNLDQSSTVQAVVDDFGPANLSTIGADFDDAAKEANVAPGNMTAQWVYGPGTDKSVAEYTAEVEAADPATHADGDDPAFLIYHGTEDRLVSPSQTLDLNNSLLDAGVDSTRYIITGAGHGDTGVGVPPEMTEPWTTEQVVGQVVDFLDGQLRG